MCWTKNKMHDCSFWETFFSWHMVGTLSRVVFIQSTSLFMTQQWVKSSLSFPLHDAKRLKEIKTKWYVAASLNKTDTCKARTNRVTKQNHCLYKVTLFLKVSIFTSLEVNCFCYVCSFWTLGGGCVFCISDSSKTFECDQICYLCVAFYRVVLLLNST